MIGLGTIINVDAEKTRQYYQAMGPGNLAAAMTAKIIVHGSKQPTRRQRNTWRGLAWRLKSRWKHPHWNPVRTE